MELVVDVFRFVHFVGFAALAGGLLVQIRNKERRVNRAVLDGAFTQLISGLVLMMLKLSDVDHLKITVKITVVIVIVVYVVIHRKRALTGGVFTVLTVLSIGNAAVAVFW